MENKPKGVIQLWLLSTFCTRPQSCLFGVLIEGAAKLFDKFGEYLEVLHDKLVDKADVKITRERHKFEKPL